MNNPVWRTVLTCEQRRVKNGMRYYFMLATCLHRVRCKASDGIPKRKRCKDCEYLASWPGRVVRVVTKEGMLVETWNSLAGAPRKETELEYQARMLEEQD